MILECQNLGRAFGGVRAVSDISFTMRAGQSLALIGPNGAGKSTTLGMLTTAIRPDHGWANICGFDVTRRAAQVRACLGVLFQDPALDDRMTPRETLNLHAALHRLPRRDTKDTIEKALDSVDLTEVADRTIRGFSGGMKRRLELARACMHAPKLLILDEPTLGLDPQGRLDLWARINALRSTGMAVLMTTHVLSEAESFDQVGIIDQGRLVALDTPAALKSGDTSATLEDVFFQRTGRALRDTQAFCGPKLVGRGT